MTNGAKYIQVIDFDGIAVVTFRDLQRAAVENPIETVGRELFALVENQDSIILDFEGKEFGPCHAFQMVLIRLHKKLGNGLKLCRLPPMVTEHFELSGLAIMLNIYSNGHEEQ